MTDDLNGKRAAMMQHSSPNKLPSTGAEELEKEEAEPEQGSVGHCRKWKHARK